MKTFIDDICTAELISRLRDFGYSDLVDTLLTFEKDCYTRKGKLNRSSICRILKITPKQLSEMFAECVAVLEERALPDVIPTNNFFS